jgi:serine phosphatase RsbU (regulator of sigma subunit)
VLVGDVSGKGLKAAMTVAAIVGALRHRRSHTPADVLAELNGILLGASGFVTCCCVLVEPDQVRIATAGHPAPYLDGVEFAGPGGLPLGLTADATYTESSANRPSILTLVSDGVVEAENPQRELFGFARTREISGQTAQEIAEAAKAWGQTDDITVVTVRGMA